MKIHKTIVLILLSGIPLTTLAIRQDRHNKHTFVNNSTDKAFHVSLLYHVCKLDKRLVHFKGEKDKNGKEYGNETIIHGGLCCLKRLDVRYAGHDAIVLEIPIDNTSQKKLAEAGAGVSIALGAGLIAGSLGGAAAISASEAAPLGYIGGAIGVVGGSEVIKGGSDLINAVKNKHNANPFVECSDNSTWIFSGANEKYTLTGAQGKTWTIDTTPKQEAPKKGRKGGRYE